MARRGKGSGPPSEYVDRKQGAKLLGASVATLNNLVSRGLLLPRHYEGKEPRFAAVEIEGLAAARKQTNLPLWEVAAMAQQAFSLARITQQKVSELQDLLGITHYVLERDEDTLHSIYEEVLQDPDENELQSVEWIRRWSGIFFSFDEVYLELVSDYIGSPEPWKVFYDFSSAIVRGKPPQFGTPALERAYAYFEGARKHLLHVSYLYCRCRHGVRIAEQVFPGGAKTALDGVMDCLMAYD